MNEVALIEVLRHHGFGGRLASIFADHIVKIARRMSERERKLTGLDTCPRTPHMAANPFGFAVMCYGGCSTFAVMCYGGCSTYKFKDAEAVEETCKDHRETMMELNRFASLTRAHVRNNPLSCVEWSPREVKRLARFFSGLDAKVLERPRSLRSFRNKKVQGSKKNP